MSKGLEAFKSIKECCPWTNKGLERLDIIEKELKVLEILKKEPYISINWYLEGTYEEYKNAIEKVKITEEEWNFVRGYCYD